jgi:hypothetical protein
LCCFAVLLLGTFLGGCSALSPGTGAQQRPLSYEERLSAPYDQTILKRSLTLDTLPKIRRSPGELGRHYEGTELLSNSDNVIVSLGQSKDGNKTWFNMFRFHEHRQNVIRKYFFLVEDKATLLRVGSRQGLRFDCEMALGQEVLDGPYANENARRIAILRHVLDNLRKDIDEVAAGVESPGQNNKMLSVCGMLMNQAFEMIRLRLDSSPVLVTRLSEAGGVNFSHINFDKGKVRMVVLGDTVAVRIRLGAFVRTM